jgi:hypothetical protein
MRISKRMKKKKVSTSPVFWRGPELREFFPQVPSKQEKNTQVNQRKTRLNI